MIFLIKKGEGKMELSIFLFLVVLSCTLVIAMRDTYFVFLALIYFVIFCFLSSWAKNLLSQGFCLAILLISTAFFGVEAKENKLIALGGASWIFGCLLFFLHGEKIINQFLNIWSSF